MVCAYEDSLKDASTSESSASNRFCIEIRAQLPANLFNTECNSSKSEEVPMDPLHCSPSPLEKLAGIEELQRFHSIKNAISSPTNFL